MFLKKWNGYIQSIWRTKEETVKKTQISLKSWKNAVFRLLVNEKTIEINRITSNRKPFNRKNENKQ